MKTSTIPPTFRISNKLYPTQSESKTQINNLLNTTSSKLIKIIIADLKTNETQLFKTHLNSISDMLNSTTNEADKQILLDHLSTIESKYRAILQKKRDKKQSTLIKNRLKFYWNRNPRYDIVDEIRIRSKLMIKFSRLGIWIVDNLILEA